jgi:hypothetical protein
MELTPNKEQKQFEYKSFYQSCHRADEFFLPTLREKNQTYEIYTKASNLYLRGPKKSEKELCKFSRHSKTE